MTDQTTKRFDSFRRASDNRASGAKCGHWLWNVLRCRGYLVARISSPSGVLHIITKADARSYGFSQTAGKTNAIRRSGSEEIDIAACEKAALLPEDVVRSHRRIDRTRKTKLSNGIGGPSKCQSRSITPEATLFYSILRHFLFLDIFQVAGVDRRPRSPCPSQVREMPPSQPAHLEEWPDSRGPPSCLLWAKIAIPRQCFIMFYISHMISYAPFMSPQGLDIFGDANRENRMINDGLQVLVHLGLGLGTKIPHHRERILGEAMLPRLRTVQWSACKNLAL